MEGLSLLSQGAHDLWAKAIESSTGAPIHHVRAGDDFEDLDGGWEHVCGLGPGGALLVRPDQHVAWRASDLPADPGLALRRALAALGLDHGPARPGGSDRASA